MAPQDPKSPNSGDAAKPASYAAAAAASEPSSSQAANPPSPRSKSPLSIGPSGPDALLKTQRHSGKAKYSQKRLSSKNSQGSPAIGYAGSPIIRSTSSDANITPMGLSHSNPTTTSNSYANTSNGVRLRKTNSHIAERKPGCRRAMLYSTDDDEAEVEADHERELSEAYQTGYLQGRRSRTNVKRQSQAKIHSPSAAPSNTRHSQFLTLDDHLAADHTENSKKGSQEEHEHRSGFVNLLGEIEYDKDHHLPGVHNLEDQFARDIEHLDEEDPESGSIHHKRIHAHHEEHAEEHDTAHSKDEEDDDEEEDSGADDGASMLSNETFTLRERQDAINITHPFGIRIWKPAVYKKTRSVQRLAEGEIHSAPIHHVSWTVWVGNFVWSLSFGIFLMLLCWSGALFLRVFFSWSKSTKAYSRKFFLIGKYMFFPFGVCVQLKPDEKYLEEDSGEGTTVAEYQEWQSTGQGRLFFSPDSIANTHTDTPDTTPRPNDDEDESSRENSHVRSDSTLSTPDFQRKRRFFGRGDWNIGRIAFYVWFYMFIYPPLFIISLICWLGVFTIPMGKVTKTLAYHIRRHPLALSFRPASTLRNLPPNEYSNSILLCTYRASGLKYYKYTVDGTNIFIMNMVAIVPLTIFDYFFLYEYLKIDAFFTQPNFIFCMSLVGIVPLAYFIGQAVASISAQSSMGMGATINAFFSTIVEVFLYCVALSQGKGDLVEGSIVGSIFGGILLLPGLSMCFGAIKRKTQRYNPKSAGVSSTMLLFAIIGAFAPTIFHQIYGTYEVRCQECTGDYANAIKVAFEENCQRCHFYQAPLTTDALFSEIIRPFGAICSLLLFVSYVIGLWFTLRTHAAMIWQTPTASELHGHIQTTVIAPTSTPAPTSLLPIVAPCSSATNPNSSSSASDTNTQKKGTAQLTAVAPVPVAVVPTTVDPNLAVTVGADNGGGHDAPNWSRTKSTVILLVATFMYSIIAEVLVDTVDGVLKSVQISEKFVGVTIFALVPNTTEFLNAISFAMNGNIALSMEIGSAYVLQVCLLQIPALVAYSMYVVSPNIPDLTDYIFTLVFPRWDLLMVVFCVFVFSYIYAEGKSNYFKGSILVLSYFVVMVGFYFTGQTREAGISGFSLISKGNVKIGS